GPEDAAHGVGVAAVEGVAIVEFDEDGQRVAGRGGPLEDLFAPQHPQIVVHLPFADELPLGRVPYVVVRGGGGQFFERVNVFARVAAVLVEGLLRPAGERLVLIVVFGVGRHVETELAPGDELVEPRLGAGA